jgi:hypothetical protein
MLHVQTGWLWVVNWVNIEGVCIILYLQANYTKQYRFEILPGLPATGEMHESFSATGTGKHSEGIVVSFSPEGAGSWIGNFQPGVGGATSVFPHPDGTHVIVIAHGQGYVVNPSTKFLKSQFNGYVQEFLQVEEERAVIFGDGTSLERLEHNGDLMWRTRRISWDGMRNVRIDNDTILGEAFTPMGDKWLPFSVNLYTGELQGGSYNGPDA